MYASRHRKQSGFTLIELLVVIAIIGTIASVVVASLGTAKAKARDTQRRANLSQIQVALELYRNEHGTFQVANSGSGGGGMGYLAHEGGNGYTTAVTRVLYNEGFLAQPIIEDPLVAPGYMIFVCSNGQAYALTATLEYPTVRDIAETQSSCNGTGANGSNSVYGKNVARKND